MTDRALGSSKGLHRKMMALLLVASALLAGCEDRANPTLDSTSEGSHVDPPAAEDAGPVTPGEEDAGPTTGSDAGPNDGHDAGPPGPTCLSSFDGDELTTGFGRIDGTLVGIARPEDVHCAKHDDNHVALEIEMNGRAYVMQVNVQSDQGAPDVYFDELSVAAPGASWSEGWHSSASLSYADDLAVHTDDFTSYDLATLTAKVVGELTIGKKISVYGNAYGPGGGHDVHKMGGYGYDGAIVVDPDLATSKVLMFRFDDSPIF